jgi:F420-non-reducing hydrogenase small subunit
MVDELEEKVMPLDEAIRVDLYLPGCPPQAGFIFDALISLVEGRAPKATDETVCGRCTRKMRKTDRRQILANHDGIPEPELCLLSQGYLCMGSVTLDRCISPCPSNGIVCTGCAGPSKQILSEPNRDIRTEIAERMSRLTQIDKSDIIHTIERGSKTHYAYAMATKMIGSKPTFLIKKWISEVEAER